jgi:hypothetical protein
MAGSEALETAAGRTSHDHRAAVEEETCLAGLGELLGGGTAWIDGQEISGRWRFRPSRATLLQIPQEGLRLCYGQKWEFSLHPRLVEGDCRGLQ